MKAETTMILAMIQDQLQSRYKTSGIKWQQDTNGVAMRIEFECGFIMNFEDVENMIRKATKCGQLDVKEFAESMECTIEELFLEQILK